MSHCKTNSSKVVVNTASYLGGVKVGLEIIKIVHLLQLLPTPSRAPHTKCKSELDIDTTSRCQGVLYHLQLCTLAKAKITGKKTEGTPCERRMTEKPSIVEHI